MSQEQENFYRHSTVIVDETKDSFLYLLEFYLTNKCITLQRFIEINIHEIYHQCYNRYPCCQCPPGTRPHIKGSRVLHPPQLEILLNNAGVKILGHNPTSMSAPHCCCPVNPHIQLQDLDFSLARFLLIGFTTLVQQGSLERNAMDFLVQSRNNAFAHAKEGRMSNIEYQKSMADIEKSLLVLAKVYRKESEVKQRLRDIHKQPLNIAICLQLQNTLLQSIQREETIKRLLDEKSLPENLTKDLEDIKVVEGCDAKLELWTMERDVNVEWYKGDCRIEASHKYVVETSFQMHSLVVTKTDLSDRGIYTANIQGYNRSARLYIEEYFTLNIKSSYQYIEGDEVELSCAVLENNVTAYWEKDGVCVQQSAKYRMKDEGKSHKLSITHIDLHDAGRYSVKISDRMRSTSIQVREYFTKPLGTMSCIEGESVQFECEVLDNNQTALWFKDGTVVISSYKYKVERQGEIHRLVINSTRLEDNGEYSVKIKNCVRRSQLKVQEIPTALKHLSIEDKALYMDIIRSGTETRYYIRIAIIGENGAGKTCLLRRLLKQSITGVISTDGIDVQNCKIRLHDGEWVYNEVSDKKKELLSRIKMAAHLSSLDDMTSMAESRNSIQSATGSQYYDDNENDKWSPDISLKSSRIKRKTKQNLLEGDFKIEKSPKKKRNVSDDSEVEMVSPFKSVTKMLTEKLLQDLDNLLNGIEKVDVPADKFVECGILDFAGEKDYYATHPIFLNPNALHVLVVNIMKDVKPITAENGFDKIGEYVDFWLDTIHSCGAMEEIKEERNTEFLDPPAIIVCTRIDECGYHLQERKEYFRKQLLRLLRNERKKNHVREICFVSNTESDECDFRCLRDTIFKYGRQLKTFVEKLPLRWIYLEQMIDFVKQAGLNILSWPDIVELSSKCSIDNEHELNLFLKYQHKVGGVIYFESLKEFIILNQKWLANAFRCLVSDKFDSNLMLTDEWKTLQETGKLEYSLIVKLFDKEPELDFNKHSSHILNVMEIFGIIVKITTLMENGQRCILPGYFMPCMISEKASLADIVYMFYAEKGYCKRTPWLCIEFDFIPFDFFNHIFCYYISQYPMCTEPQTGRMAIYHGMGVFFLDSTKFRKFILCFCKNTIALQIWQWKNVEKGTCKAMLEELKVAIGRVKDQFESRRVSYTVKSKCSDGNIHSSDGRHSYSELLNLEDEYFCEEHSNSHRIQDLFQTWFEDFTENEEYKFKDMGPSRIGTIEDIDVDTTDVLMHIKRRSEDQMSCIKHTKHIKQFCSTHKEPICDVCFKENHNKCSLIAIKTALATVGQVKGNIKANIEKQLKLLQTMETDMLANQEIVMAALKELGEKKKNFEQIMANVNDVKSENPTLEHLVDVYNIQKRMKRSIKKLQKMSKKKSMATFKDINFDFKDLQNTFTHFKIEPIYPNITLQLKIKTSVDIALKSKYPHLVRGCTLYSDNKVCLVDTANDFLVIVYLHESPELPASNKKLKCISLPGRPFDVQSSGKHLVVTLRQNRAICFIEQHSLETPNINVEQVVFRNINCGSIGGISCFGDEFAVVVECFGFYILDQIGGVKDKIEIKDCVNIQYVSYYNNKLYYTKSDENNVYCCNKEGNNLWTFQDTNLIKAPKGITVDETENIYVAGLYSNNVVVISPDGTRCTEILGSITDMSRIHAIDYNIMTKTLLVCSENGHVHLYNVLKNN